MYAKWQLSIYLILIISRCVCESVVVVIFCNISPDQIELATSELHFMLPQVKLSMSEWMNEWMGWNWNINNRVPHIIYCATATTIKITELLFFNVACINLHYLPNINCCCSFCCQIWCFVCARFFHDTCTFQEAPSHAKSLHYIAVIEQSLII